MSFEIDYSVILDHMLRAVEANRDVRRYFQSDNRPTVDQILEHLTIRLSGPGRDALTTTLVETAVDGDLILCLDTKRVVDFNGRLRERVGVDHGCKVIGFPRFRTHLDYCKRIDGITPTRIFINDASRCIKSPLVIRKLASWSATHCVAPTLVLLG